jgi:hypothetical protein
MMRQVKSLILVLTLAAGGWALLADVGRAEPSRSADAVPALVRLTPSTPAFYWHLGEVYNPASDRYFFFYFAPNGQDAVIWCRSFDRRGRPLSGFQKIVELPDEWISQGAAAYNDRDKCMFLAWSSGSYDVVKGMPLDNFGRNMTGVARIIDIKPSQGYNTALDLQVAWLPAVNRYAIAWTYADDRVPYNAMNGPYLTVLNRDWTVRMKAKKLYSLFQKNDLHSLFLLPVGNKLLWTGREDGPGSSLMPLAFFTDLQGRLLTSYGSKGVFHPGGTIRGLGEVRAAADPAGRVILLYWPVGDAKHDISRASQNYRILDGDGVYGGPAGTMPRKMPIQLYASVCFNAAENRFFWVVQEHSIHYQATPSRQDFKGTLWGYYMDTDGNLVTKGGGIGVAPVALTKTVTDPAFGTRLWGLVINPYDNSYWTGYWRETIGRGIWDFWGLIYK